MFRVKVDSSDRRRTTTVEIPSSHVAMVSHAGEVAELIDKATESVGATAARERGGSR